MAALLGVDPEQAYVAGLLHDIAKPLPNQELLRRAGNYRLPEDSISGLLPPCCMLPWAPPCSSTNTA
jgi:HD superfamily phosphohydrolase YqeK